MSVLISIHVLSRLACRFHICLHICIYVMIILLRNNIGLLDFKLSSGGLLTTFLENNANHAAKILKVPMPTLSDVQETRA